MKNMCRLQINKQKFKSVYVSQNVVLLTSSEFSITPRAVIVYWARYMGSEVDLWSDVLNIYSSLWGHHIADPH